MDAILKQLTNPEWWFTVVGMGLVIGVAGAYVKDWLATVLSSVSGRMKKHFEGRRKETEARIFRMVRTPQLLVVEYFRTVLTLAGSVLLIAGSFVLPAWHVFQVAFPSVDPVVSVLGVPQPGERFNQLFSLLSGAYGMVLWIKGMQKLKFCELVRRRIERDAV